jgi:hypothetical protein
MVRSAVVAFILSAFALPAFSGTHKETYPNACSEVWTEVKDTLGNSENYTVEITDEARMAATYNVKHAAHVTITGALSQPQCVQAHLIVENPIRLGPAGKGKFRLIQDALKIRYIVAFSFAARGGHRPL